MFKGTSKNLFFFNLFNTEYYIGVSIIGKINCYSFIECLVFYSKINMDGSKIKVASKFGFVLWFGPPLQ